MDSLLLLWLWNSHWNIITCSSLDPKPYFHNFLPFEFRLVSEHFRTYRKDMALIISGFWVWTRFVVQTRKLRKRRVDTYSNVHSSPRRLPGEKKNYSYNHKTTIWISHEYYLIPEFHKILWRAFWVIAILRFSPYAARVDFKGLISK